MSTSEQPLRWGLLGSARINDRIVQAVAMSERSRISAIASRDASRARAYARSAGIPHSFGGYDRMLASDEVAAIFPLEESGVNMATIRALVESANRRKVVKVCE